MSAGRPAGRLTARAPAKLNLGLWIVRRRPDGYHDLLTLFTAIDLEDTLAVEARPRGLSLSIDGPAAAPGGRRLPTGPDNLVLVAARRLQAATGCRKGAAFRLTKRIPAGSGLGGGSSDAAAALLLLDRLWNLGLPAARLARLAGEIGSDVPFFLRGGMQVGRGRGTRLTPLAAQDRLEFLLVHGSRPISAKSAYSQYKRELTASRPPSSIVALAAGDRCPRVSLKHLDNHLEAGLVSDFPDIAERKQALLTAGAAAALLTGSGSTVFGIFAGRPAARRAGRLLGRRGYSVDLCRSIRHGVVVSG